MERIAATIPSTLENRLPSAPRRRPTHLGVTLRPPWNSSIVNLRTADARGVQRRRPVGVSRTEGDGDRREERGFERTSARGRVTGTSRRAGASLLAAWEARKARAFADVDREVLVLTRADMVIASVTSNPINLRQEK